MKARLELSMAEPADVVLAVVLYSLFGIFCAAVLIGVWVQVEVARSICRRDNRPFSWLWMISLPGQWRILSNFYFEATTSGLWRRWLWSMALAVLPLGLVVGLVFIFGETVN
jgi:hypothetical protein